MAVDSQNLLHRFNSLSRQPAARQLGLLLGLAASIALALGLVQWAMEPDFSALYGELSPAASAEVARSLEGSGIRYKLNNRTGQVSVPADQVHDVRLKLASEGLPSGDGSGFDMLYKEAEMGISSFMEKARFDRALEQELSSSIAALDSVRSARVHLALPKQSAFVRKKNKPAASVLLSLYPGRELTERQLAGVVHLVAFSVPGLDAENVSVVDGRGKLLSSQNKNDDFAYTNEQFRFARQLEQSYVNRITNILTPILGAEAVRAEVTTELDFTTVEKTSEQYSPEAKIRSEQMVEELANGLSSGGIPGTLSNQPPEEVAVVGGEAKADGETTNASPGRSSKREVRNYELDKTISHVRDAPGALKRLSVAVVVDYQRVMNAEGVEEQLPLAEERLSEIKALVKEAVGFDESRGDSLNVLNSSFVSAPELEAMPEASFMEQEWVWRSAKLGLVGIAVMLVIFTVLRPLMQASSAPAPAPAQQLAVQGGGQPGAGGVMAMPSADNLALGEDQVTLGGQQVPGLPAGATGYQQQLSMARAVVEGEPERAAHVVKGWVAADG